MCLPIGSGVQWTCSAKRMTLNWKKSIKAQWLQLVLNIRGLERGGKGSAAAAVLSLQRQSMFNLKKKTTKKFQLNYFHQINTGQIFNLKDMKLVGLFKCGTGCIIKLPHWTTHWGLDVNLSIDVKTSNSIKLGSVCLEGSMFRQFRIALLLQWIVEALFCSLQWIFVSELVLKRNFCSIWKLQSKKSTTRNCIFGQNKVKLYEYSCCLHFAKWFDHPV